MSTEQTPNPPELTLRDLFAGEAMKNIKPVFYVGEKETERSLADYAKKCYQVSDAMLKARSELNSK